MLTCAKVSLIGNLGGDPETRYTPNGAMLVNFSAAVSSKRGQEELTNWYNVTAWGKLGEILDKQANEGRFLKGSQVFVVGDLALTQYTKKNGEAGYSLNVRANSVTFNEPRNRDESSNRMKGEIDYPDLDDVPF